MATRSWKSKHTEDEIQPPIASKRLDRIYLKKNSKWTFTKAEVLAKEPIFRSDCGNFNMYISDHYALKANVKCAERPVVKTEDSSSLTPGFLGVVGIGIGITATLVGLYLWYSRKE